MRCIDVNLEHSCYRPCLTCCASPRVVTLARYAIALLFTTTPGVVVLELTGFPFVVTRTFAAGLLRTLAVLRRF